MVDILAMCPFTIYADLQLWICADGKVQKYLGDVQSYKVCPYEVVGSNADGTESYRRFHPGQDSTVGVDRMHLAVIFLITLHD